jgi:hypothetical protein
LKLLWFFATLGLVRRAKDAPKREDARETRRSIVTGSGIAISNRRGCRAIPAAAVLLACPLLATSGQRADLSVHAKLVLIPVTVTDRHGKAIPGLGPEHFRVYEDSEPRDVLSLARQDGAAAVGIVLDLSGSMRRSEGEALAAARAIRAALDEEDESFLLAFHDGVSMVSDMRTARAHGGTALVDAVWAALDEARARSRQHPALVVISDGGENASRRGLAELKRRALEADVPIHSIAIEDRQRVWVLEELSAITGGLHFMIRDGRGLPEVAAKLARAMKEQYVLAYRPSATGPPKWRKVRVSVTPPDAQRVRVTARSGYYYSD